MVRGCLDIWNLVVLFIPPIAVCVDYDIFLFQG